MPSVTVPPWMARKLVAARDQVRSEQSNPNRKWILLLLLAWIVAGVLAITIPRGQFSTNRSAYYSTYGRYVEYENQQRQYEQQQNNNNNNNNNNGNYNNGNYGYPECSWYQWQCRKRQYYYRMQNGDGNQDNQVYTPTWYRFIGGREGGEEDERFYEEMGIAQPDDPSATGAVKFVHGWTQFLFVSLLAYGAGVIYLGRPINGLVVCMIFFAQFSLLNTVLVCQGVIRTDGRDLENSIYGWQGQLPVLMAYQSFSSFLFCLGFCLFFFVRYAIKRFIANKNGSAAGGGGQQNAASKEGGAAAAEESNYTKPGVYKNLHEESRTDVNTQSNGYSSMA